MPLRHRIALTLAGSLALSAAVATAEPLFTLSADGRSFLYVTRPGDHPGRVAELFGIPTTEVDALLTANGVRDATRIGPGFVFKIPNPVAAEAERVAAENTRLVREAASAGERLRSLEHDATTARADAAAATERAERLAGLEVWWPAAKTAVVLLAVAAACLAALAVAAVRRQQRGARYAGGLARDLEDRRRTALAERQESARRIIELEDRVRTLEAKLAPRVVIGGR